MGPKALPGARIVISRITLFSLLLALMLASGIWIWNNGHPDDCARTMSATGTMPRAEYVISGTRQISVPCNDWIMRQSLTVQILCLLELLLAVIFLLNALSDLREGLEARRRIRQAK
jgi:hypothetical protein